MPKQKSALFILWMTALAFSLFAIGVVQLAAPSAEQVHTERQGLRNNKTLQLVRRTHDELGTVWFVPEGRRVTIRGQRMEPSLRSSTGSVHATSRGKGKETRFMQTLDAAKADGSARTLQSSVAKTLAMPDARNLTIALLRMPSRLTNEQNREGGHGSGVLPVLMMMASIVFGVAFFFFVKSGRNHRKWESELLLNDDDDDLSFSISYATPSSNVGYGSFVHSWTDDFDKFDL